MKDGIVPVRQLLPIFRKVRPVKLENEEGIVPVSPHGGAE